MNEISQKLDEVEDERNETEDEHNSDLKAERRSNWNLKKTLKGYQDK